MLKPKNFLLFIFALTLPSYSCVVAAQTKAIAFTIDDLPLNGPAIEIKRLERMTEKILTVTRKNQIPMIGFVNEIQLYVANETDARIGVLKMWSDAGVELGNHTFSHLGFKGVSIEAYEDDFVRGDSVVNLLVKPRKARYFRHPFLQMGETREIEERFEKFIAERGYKAVPVTIDTMDWMFLAAYAKALKEKDKAFQKRVSDDYLRFVALRIDAGEKIANNLFGRQIKHILLLHANELNADNFAALADIFKDKGYRFITVEDALQDAAYRFPEKYAPTSDWLFHWSLSEGRKIDVPAPPDYIQQIYQGK
ncbi:MAG TPA: polysaccharide deacetylase family protein [Pyrinomonadaceae bacterium]|jgi:peptidoglycan/xylan/chitin deacetylase (PgdA/CDA1 family)